VTTLEFSLKEFSIKMRDWSEEVQVNLEESPCVVLTGINAGGKTLTLRMLEDFCDLLVEPSRVKTHRFQKFALAAKIDSMRVRFEYDWLDLNNLIMWPGEASKIPWLRLAEAENDWYFPDIDWEKLSSRFGVGNTLILQEESRPIIRSSIMVEYEFEAFHEGNEGAAPHIKFRRRDGIKFDVTGYFRDDLLPVPVPSFSEVIREEDFRVVCTSPPLGSHREIERLDSFGPWDTYANRWQSELAEKTGLRFDDGAFEWAADDNYEFYDPVKMLRFSINAPKMQGVTEAYALSMLDRGELNDMFSDWEGVDGANLVLEELWNEVVGGHERKLKMILLDNIVARALPFVRSNNGKPEGTPEATDDERRQIMEEIADVEDLGEFNDEDHFILLFSRRWAEKQFFDHDEVESRYGSPPLDDPPHLSGWGDLSNESLALLIESEPDFGLWWALREFIDEIPEVPSSGQLRLLSMMSRLLEMPPHSTILIDEPELSLHIDWQERLISALIKSLPDRKFVIATHAPSIISDHMEKVVQIPPSDNS